MITLNIKNVNATLRGKITTIVVVSIGMTEEKIAEDTQNYLSTNADLFKVSMTFWIKKSEALKAAGVEFSSVTEVTCKGCGK